ncbi:MAG TPA: 5'-nucleotidase [Prolixibacteraceae bacterium]|nr:5'-nucleotidase [Prolixibacteraceae bacterium]
MYRSIKSVLLITGVLLLAFSCRTPFEVARAIPENYPVSEKLAAVDSQLVRFYLPYKQELEKDMAEVLAVAETELVKDKPESLLTNFLADLLREEGAVTSRQSGWGITPDLAYFNYGGIRTFLPKGDITVGKIFELMPFENEMVFLKLKGADVQAFLNELASKGGDSVSGVRFGIRENRAVKIMIDGKPLDENAAYWLVTNDYVASGGDNMQMLLNRIDFKNSSEKIRDVIIRHLKAMQERGERISPVLDGRIYHE